LSSRRTALPIAIDPTSADTGIGRDDLTRSTTWFVLAATGAMALLGSLSLWQARLDAAACAVDAQRLLILCIAQPDAWRFAVTVGIGAIAAAAAVRELGVRR
jgi:hypothetical protein